MRSRLAARLALAGLLSLALPGVAVADDDMMGDPGGSQGMGGTQGGGGMQGMGGMHGGMQGGPSDPQAAQADAHAQLQRIREHTRKMDSVHDPNQLMMEMRIHMRMTDEFMESLMSRATQPPTGAPGGCGGAPAQQPMQME
jgi:hypothetical protein